MLGEEKKKIMKSLRKLVTFLLCLVFPVRLIFWLLNMMGHHVHATAKIGFSIIWINGLLVLREATRIGKFNVINNNGIVIEKDGYIGNFNKLNGPFEIILEKGAAIGNANKCYRAPLGVTYGNAQLRLGELSKITSRHQVDCTRSITIGAFSTIAGHDSQLWTHAYYHDRTGPGRFRLDGTIEIGDNVNIGSRSVLNCGIKIADGVVIGSNSSVSKSLLKAGSYVSQPLRFIENSGDQRSRFKKIEDPSICEQVYEKLS